MLQVAITTTLMISPTIRSQTDACMAEVWNSVSAKISSASSNHTYARGRLADDAVEMASSARSRMGEEKITSSTPTAYAR